MVNKQYKIQHNLDNNYTNQKPTQRSSNNKSQLIFKNTSTIPSTITSSGPRTYSVSSDNTPSFTSYESINTNKNIGENLIILPKSNRNNFTLKSNSRNNFEDNFNSTNSSSIESVYGKNIKMSYDGNNDGQSKKNSKYSRNHFNNHPDQYEVRDLTINDIGRFQYILQMDKELGTYPESYYHLSSKNYQNNGLPTTESDFKSVSLNSSNGKNSINFWKAGAATDYPIKPTTTTTSTSSSISSKPLQFRNRASEMFYWHKHNLIEHSRTFWSYAKWPILLLLFCLVLSCIIFLLFMMGTANVSRNSSSISSHNDFNDNNIMSANFSEERISLTDFDDDLQIIENDDYNINDRYNDGKEIYNNNNNKNDHNEILTIYMRTSNKSSVGNLNKIKTTPAPSTHIKTGILLQEIDFELDTGDNDSNNDDEKFEEKIKIIKNYASTTRNPLFRNTQIMKFTTVKGFQPDDDILVSSTTETLIDGNGKEKTLLSSILPPTKETLQVIGFTSGHQNNFGVPIEEDERILRLLNDEIIKYESQDNNLTTENPEIQSSSSTTAVKVSPTLPLIIHHKDTSPSRFRTTTESLISMLNSTDACESTSLDICQGVLRYDLTTTKSKRKLESMDLEHFKYLIASKCSNRAAEFICSVLEPECRSAKLGSLQPCKRICKSILEPCAGLISSSEILTMTFDCDRYPDSSDRNVCEDPTRRGNKCYDNEYQCLDYTCIPKQWKCDNIKDCSLGEDEENCQFCRHDEFQCQSDAKCITDKWHCDGYNDCDDASDENDCENEYDDLNDEFNDEDNIDDENVDDYNTRIYNLFTDQVQETTPNQLNDDRLNGLPFLAISAADNNDSYDKNLKYGNNEGLFGKDAIDSIESKVNLTINKKSSSEDEEDDEIQTGEASGRVVIGIPQNQGLGNFQDSTEIMMTSDSQNDFKYSKVIRGNNRIRNGSTTNTTSNKKTTMTTSGGSTTRSSLRLTTLSRRGTTTTTTTTTTSKPISTKLLRTSTKSRKTTLPTTTTPKTSKDHSTLCPGAQLRCVSGKCINVDQLCDKIIDCPDGADEARCVYKEDDDKTN